MGGQTCTVCTHEAKEAINQALVASTSLRDIAGQYGLSKSALDRHQQAHLSATLVKAAEAQDAAHGSRLLEQVTGLVDKALASAERSEAKGDERAVQGGLREARHSLELTGRLTGELRESNKDNGPESATDTIQALAKGVAEAFLRHMAAGLREEDYIEVEGHVVDPD